MEKRRAQLLCMGMLSTSSNNGAPDNQTRACIDPQGPVTGIAFLPGRPSLVFSCGADGRIHITDRHAGPSPRAVIECGTPFCSMSIRDEGSIIAAGTAGA